MEINPRLHSIPGTLKSPKSRNQKLQMSNMFSKQLKCWLSVFIVVSGTK